MSIPCQYAGFECEALRQERDALVVMLQNLVYAEDRRHGPGYRLGEASHVDLGNLSTAVRAVLAKAGS